VLQSYAVATASLDARESRHFAGDAAPERLLVDLQGLDTRHPLMDAPRTWRTILRRYEPLAQDRRWLALGLRPRPREVEELRLGETVARLDEAVPCPRPRSGHLEIRIRLEPSRTGRLAAVLWKLPEVRLGTVGTELRAPRRVVAATAGEPFPLTDPWPESPATTRLLFGGHDLPAPGGMAFVTAGAWAWRPVEVEFFRVEWREPPPAPP
jgi:hypothetical protein